MMTYTESKGNTFIGKTGNFDWMDCVDSISCLDENLVDVTTPNEKRLSAIFACQHSSFLMHE